MRNERGVAPGQHGALADSEAMLLVYYYKAEIFNAYVFLNQGVGADDDIPIRRPFFLVRSDDEADGYGKGRERF